MGSRQLQGNSRNLTNHIHEKASEDEVTNEILVTYTIYLCIKYTEHLLKNHIRTQLRLLGRFMLRIKVHDIKTCKDVIDSKNIDTVREAVGELDPLTNIYKHPTNAQTLFTELKKIVLVVKSESDKPDDTILMKKPKVFSCRIK